MDTGLLIQELTSKLTAAGVMVYALQAVKRARWFPWLSMHTETANRWVAAAVAILTSIGLHFAYEPTGGTLTISGLTVVGVLAGSWDALQQWVGQQVVYDVVASKKTDTTEGVN